jgi:hypothetical protein
VLLGANRIEKSFHYAVAYLEVFTDPLPGNVLIISVTILNELNWTRMSTFSSDCAELSE